MTPRWLGIALLCVGAANALIGTTLVLQSTTKNIWAYFIVLGGVVLMICGYFIGKRKSWNLAHGHPGGPKRSHVQAAVVRPVSY